MEVTEKKEGSLGSDPWASETTYQKQQQRQKALLHHLQAARTTVERAMDQAPRESSRTPRRKDTEQANEVTDLHPGKASA